MAEVNHRLYRAYLLKEELRLVFKLKGPRAIALLDAWLAWARRCRIPAFVTLAKAITNHRAGIQATLTHGLSNGLTESVNTKIRLAHPGPHRVRLQVPRRAHRSPCSASVACAHPCQAAAERGDQRLATTKPLAVGTAPAYTATARSRLQHTNVVEGLARSRTAAAANSSARRPASRSASTARASPARARGVSS